MAAALDAAHAHGLVHRDVKPAQHPAGRGGRGDRPGHAYLSDFGLSKRALSVSALTSTGQFLGTLDYIAPEQIEARAVDGRTDEYALACAAFEMLAVLGYESQMDVLAARLGISRTQVRERNFLAKGDLLPSGERVGTCVEVGRTMTARSPCSASVPAVRAGESDRPRHRLQPAAVRAGDLVPRQRLGLAQPASGRTMLIRCGVTDLGAGQAASLCQIAAEVLGAPLDDISIYIGDSALNPPAGGTFATRQLYMSGNAVLQAASNCASGWRRWRPTCSACHPATLEFAAGRVRAADNGVSVTLAELAAACEQRAISTAHLSTWRGEALSFHPRTGQGCTFPDYTYGTHAADVEVDTETGQVRVLRYAACHDVGRAINPMRVEGQIQGGAMQGLGYALTEDMGIDDGYVQAGLFANYLIPNAQDFPDVLVGIYRERRGQGPARGARDRRAADRERGRHHRQRHPGRDRRPPRPAADDPRAGARADRHARHLSAGLGSSCQEIRQPYGKL